MWWQNAITIFFNICDKKGLSALAAQYKINNMENLETIKEGVAPNNFSRFTEDDASLEEKPRPPKSVMEGLSFLEI